MKIDIFNYFMPKPYLERAACYGFIGALQRER
jgi:hypothetical protein